MLNKYKHRTSRASQQQLVAAVQVSIKNKKSISKEIIIIVVHSQLIWIVFCEVKILARRS